MTDKIKNYGYPRMLSVPDAINKMRLGGNANRDLCYGARIAAMRSYEEFAKEKGVHNMMDMKSIFNIKHSVVPPICEEVTTILPLDSENVLIGTGSSENELIVVNWRKVREANFEFKRSRNELRKNINFPILSKPRTEFSVQRVTKLLPRTAEVQWHGGVQGLTMNDDGTLIACSSRSAKDLTILAFNRDEKWSEDREEINEESSRRERVIYTGFDSLIHGWQRNPTLPNHWRTEDDKEIKKFGLYTNAGFLERFGQGQGHTRNITGTCWYGNKQVVSVGDDGYVVLWDVDETKSEEERESWPTKMVSVTKKEDQNEVVRTSNRIHQREILSTLGERENRAKLIGVNKINGCEKIVTCTSRAKILIMDGVSPNNPVIRKVPCEHLPISKFLPETRLLTAQDVHQDTGEIVVATPYHFVLFDQRKEDPTAVVNVYEKGRVGLYNGPVTAINAGCGLICVGHKSGNIQMFDRRTCKVITDEKQAYNIEPSWLADHLDKAVMDGPFDVYPVKAIARQNHKIIAGGGPVTCNGEFWTMATLSIFE